MSETTVDAPGEAERPAHRRSLLWDHIDRIRAMLAERYSYEQIARALALRGVHLSGSEVGKWCRRQGLRSVVSSRHRADKKSAAQVPPAAAAPAATPSSAAQPATSSSEAAAADRLRSILGRPVR